MGIMDEKPGIYIYHQLLWQFEYSDFFRAITFSEETRIKATPDEL